MISPPKNKVIRVISLYNKQSNPISGPGVHHFALDIRLRPKHSVVLASLLEGGYAAFDFVPADAEDPKAAVQLLLGADDEGMDGYGTRWRLDKWFWGRMWRGRWEWKQELRRAGEIFCFVWEFGRLEIRWTYGLWSKQASIMMRVKRCKESECTNS